jgi:hypothetical protein
MVWLDFGLPLALVLPIFAIMPLLAHAGLPNTADGPVHLMRQVELNEAWQEGNFYPRWGTDLALGHGMPIFSYAPPALYQLTQLFHGVGLPLDEAMKAVLIVDFLLYSSGMFLFARRLYGAGPALLAAALYVYAPYRLREATIQGNYGQFTGLAFYPLIFWAFHGLVTDGRPRYLIAAALSLAGLLFSHNISAMLFAPMFTSYLVALLLLTTFQTNHRPNLDPPRPPHPISHIPYSTLLRITAAGLLGLGLAAIFWLPAFGERHDIKLEGIVQGFFDFRENFISLPEFLSPPLPLDLTAINPEFPLSLGLPQIIGAGLGLLSLVILAITTLKRPLRKPQDRPHETRVPASPLLHSLFFAFFLLLYAFLAIPQSQSVWETVPLLELAEFPWRMLGPAIFCASLLAATPVWLLTRLWMARPNPHPQPPAPTPALRLQPHLLFRSILLSAILLTIGLNAPYLYPSQFIVWGTPTPAEAFAYEVTSGAIGTTSTGEFLPRGARQHPRPETLWPDYAAGRPPQIIDPATLPAGANVKTISHRAESDAVQIETPTDFNATIRTLYWPGWQVYLNEQPVDFSIIDKTGLIQTTIPAGQHTLSVRLETTPLRTLGRWLTIISAFSLVIIGILAAVRRRSPVVHQQDSSVLESKQVQTASSFGISPGFLATTGVILIAAYLLSRPLEPLFVWRSDPNYPRPAARVLQVDFEDQIRLVGVDTWPETIELDESGATDLAVTVYWRALRQLETNYSIFLHLDAPNGQTLATVDEVNPENIPTRNWPPGLYLRNPLHLDLPPDMPPIRYDLNVGVYDRESNNRLALASGDSTAFTLGSIWLSTTTPPLIGEPLAHFGQDITLVEATYSSTINESLALYWQTSRPIAHDYSIFVHLLDQQGNLLGQKDGAPYEGLYPLRNWQPGQIIIDRRQLPELGKTMTQLDTLAIGVYDPVTGERLPATDAQGKPLPNNRFILPVN